MSKKKQITEDDVHEYWESQAKTHKSSYLATVPDLYSHQKEIQVFKKYLKDDIRVLEFGCGNGILSRELSRAYRFQSYVGVDYSSSMVAECQRGVEGDFVGKPPDYHTGNVLTYRPRRPVDYVLTDRCLINLGNHEQQVKALINIHGCLNEGGTFLMAECSKLSLANLNAARKKYSLPPIPERWHNSYLNEGRLLKDIRSYFTLDTVDSFNSSYFLISRTLNACIDTGEQGPDYLSDINRLASMLPAEGDYAPLKLFILKKK